MPLFKILFSRIPLLLVFINSIVYAQPFQIGNKSVFVANNKLSQSTQLYRCDAAAQTLTSLGSQGSRKLNALAYNPADDYLYAIEDMGYDSTYASIDNRGKVLKINNTGVITALGYFTFPGGTSQGKQILSGTFDLSGNFYLYDTEDRPGSKVIYKIANIATGNLAATTITPNQSVFFTDFTFNPYDGFLYALGGSGSQSNQETNRIIKINATSGATTFVTPSNGSVDNALRPSFYEGAGAAWSDDEGNIFFYNNGGYILKYNLINTQYSTVSTAMPNAFDADGAANIVAVVNKDPAVSIAITANGTTATSSTTLVNNNTNAAPDVIVSVALSNTLGYTSFTVKNAAGTVVPLSANVYSTVSIPPSGTTGPILKLHFNSLLPGSSNKYIIEMNGTRTTPNIQEQLTATVQITGINGQTLNNNNLQNNTDNISWVIGDQANNNDASVTTTTQPLSISPLDPAIVPTAFSYENKIYIDAKGIASTYHIYNSTGKLLFSGTTLKREVVTPDVAGIYLIKLKYNDTITVTKVLIY
jgi:hypothetical protein